MADHSTHHDSSSSTDTAKSRTAFRSSLWFVLILVGLFIAALNFVEIMGHSEEGHKKTEATSEETLKGETGPGHVVEDTTQHAATMTTNDSAAHAEHH